MPPQPAAAARSLRAKLAVSSLSQCLYATHSAWKSFGIHRIANVLHKLPQRLQRKAKRALYEMMYADIRSACEAEMAKFAKELVAKYLKAVDSLTTDADRLVGHFDFPPVLHS